MAKNRVQHISGLANLKNLYVVALQANFIESLKGIEEASTIEELYLQQNNIKKIEAVDKIPGLTILDLAMNEVEVIEGLEGNKALTDLWINNNKIAAKESLEYLNRLPNLEVVYIAGNPVTTVLPAVEVIKANVPKLRQVDGETMKPEIGVKVGGPGVPGIVRKPIDPKADKLLKEVIVKKE